MSRNFIFNDLITLKKYVPKFMDNDKLDFDFITPDRYKKDNEIDKFGCYSNAINTELPDDYEDLSDDDLVSIHFETVKNAPLEWLKLLRENNIPFDLIWYSDDNSNAGRIYAEFNSREIKSISFTDTYSLFDVMRTKQWKEIKYN